MSRAASVQTVHLALEAPEEDVLVLAGGAHRAILEVGSVNFAVLDPPAQEALVAGYAAVLNGLTFPVQLLVRVTHLDLDRYLDDLDARARQEPNPALAHLATDQAASLRRRARSQTLLERRCYLVVPADDAGPGPGSPWAVLAGLFGRRRAAPHVAGAAARKQLAFRCDELVGQLGRCGLGARRLRSGELLHLYYACWCPELARTQRLRRDLADYTTLVIGAAHRPGHGDRGGAPSGTAPAGRIPRSA